MTRSTPASWRLVAVVLLPFAAGFYLSYLFRTINAVISDQLARELSLGPAQLGLLTSAYFLTMAAAQIPVGVLLDRYGPRRVQSVCLLVAAAGAALFAVSQGMIGLVVGRALIGRWLLDTPVLLYRTSDGRAVALDNRCPHRGAPLSLGCLKDDRPPLFLSLQESARP